eukprot:TRINITY_DN7208_c0_g1_i1.p1 TRINITY_DN7208_c0_g1~~TRINITY_DN7208_c0_g1_i1.p1  ORF type:complete len:261 (+),score=79.73 TRINITY_DN7208_c0_g1_i1:69-851(+)
MQVARLKVGKTQFEVATKSGQALLFRQGKVDFASVLETEEIWKDVKKGDRASVAELQEAFGELSLTEVATKIVTKGALQYSESERKEFVAKKRREIIGFLHKNFVDPKTNRSIPNERIENALTDLKFRVDPDEQVDKQVAKILKNIVSVLPIKKMEMVTGSVTIPHAHLGKAQGIVRSVVTVTGESYSATGATLNLSFAPSEYEVLIDALNRVCRDEYELIANNLETPPSPAPSSGQGKKGKGKKRGGGRGGRGRGGKRK